MYLILFTFVRINHTKIKMTVLVAGASGATGKRLVEQLLIKEHIVIAIVRAPEKMPKSLIDHKKLSLIQGSIL